MWLYYLLVYVFALQNHWFWSQQVSDFGNMTVIKLLGFAVLAYAFLYGVRKARLSCLANRTTTLFLLLFFLAAVSFLLQAWGFVAGLYTREGGLLSATPLASYMAMMSLLISTFLLVDSWPKLQNTLRASLGGISLGALYVIREYQLYHDVHPGMRPGWVVGDPNYFSAGAVVCLPIGLALLRMEKRRLFRFGVAGALLITILGLVLSASRGALVALAAVFLFAFLRSNFWRKRLVLVGGLMVLLSVALPQSPMSRLFSPSKSDSESIELRKQLIRAGFHMVAEQPVMGVGLGNFRRGAAPFLTTEAMPFLGGNIWLTAHNTYLEVAAELGLPALLILLGLIFESWRGLARIQRDASDAKSQLQAVCFGLQGSLVAFLMVSVFITAHYQRYFWLFVFLSAVAVRLASPAESREARRVSLPRTMRARAVRYP